MKDKYHMSVPQNIEVAKRLMIDSIWKSTVFEGFAVTFPETSEIFEGRIAQAIELKAVLTINNLKRAWKFLLDNIEYPLDLKYICHLNYLVGGDDLVRKAGYLRVQGEDVRIGGTSWKPNIPNQHEVEIELNHILDNTSMSHTEKALRLMGYLMRSQLFLDGNKRTAMLVANHILIQNGVGLMQVEVENNLEFKNKLIQYYETNNIEDFIQYVFSTCLYGEIHEKEREILNKRSLSRDDFER